MKWNELFKIDQMPSIADIRNYIGETKPIWDELVLYLEKTYKPKRQLDYSKDSLQPGWNVKYRKSGKALCTFYPMEGYFIALIVVGPKEKEKVRHDMEAALFSESVKKLYEKSAYSTMGRWLMIEVKDKSVLNDIKPLIGIRIMPKELEANMKTLNELIKGYTHHLQQGEIQIAYKGIFEFLSRLRTEFIRKYTHYDVSSVYQGYMDMSYFSLSTKSLKDKGLKIAIVYVHKKGNFEAWLSARNRDVRKSYMGSLNSNIYGEDLNFFHDNNNSDAIIECILTNTPNFDDQTSLIEIIDQGVEKFVKKINDSL